MLLITLAFGYTGSWLPRVQGATLRQDLDDNTTLYGKPLENRDIVTNGIAAPPAAAKLLALLNRYSAREHTN